MLELKVILNDFGFSNVIGIFHLIWMFSFIVLILSGSLVLVKVNNEINSLKLKKKMDYLILSSVLIVVIGVGLTLLSELINAPDLGFAGMAVSFMIAWFAFKK